MYSDIGCKSACRKAYILEPKLKKFWNLMLVDGNLFYWKMSHFSQLLYTEAVVENSKSGLFILKISASDPDIGTNGQVSFTLHGPNADKFHLDSKTGNFDLSILLRISSSIHCSLRLLLLTVRGNQTNKEDKRQLSHDIWNFWNSL